jgi:hypothetical protein
MISPKKSNDDCREGKCSYASKDGIRQQRKEHINRNVSPKNRGQGEIRILAQCEQGDGIAIAACGLDFQP